MDGDHMKNDNKTSHNAEIYDSQIESTIPYYDSIHHVDQFLV